MDPKIPINAREQLLKCQEKQKFYYDKGAKPLKPLESGDTIRYYKEKTWEPAVVVNRHDAPRSYNIEAESGSKLRRNRVHLRKTLENRPNIETEIDYDNLITSSQSDEQRTQDANINTRSLRPRENIRKPARYRDN